MMLPIVFVNIGNLPSEIKLTEGQEIAFVQNNRGAMGGPSLKSVDFPSACFTAKPTPQTTLEHQPEGTSIHSIAEASSVGSGVITLHLTHTTAKPNFTETVSVEVVAPKVGR